MHLIHSSLADVDQTQHHSVQAEEDVISSDRVDPIWVFD